MATKLRCPMCGLLDFPQLEEKANNLVARCKECNHFIKNLPHKEAPDFPFITEEEYQEDASRWEDIGNSTYVRIDGTTIYIQNNKYIDTPLEARVTITARQLGKIFKLLFDSGGHITDE